MIERLTISNFKSLVDFDLPLSRLTCLIGLNGSGKTSVLQALDFLATLATGNVETWLKQREWKKSDLTSKFVKSPIIPFALMLRSASTPISWVGRYNVLHEKCTHETVLAFDFEDHPTPLLVHTRGHLTLHEKQKGVRRQKTDTFDYKGSILSILDTRNLHPHLDLLKTSLKGIRSLDMLAPSLMRKRAKEGQDVGRGGERLSAYLHGLSPPARQRLTEDLKIFYPVVQGWETSSMQAGWKDLRLRETYPDAQGRPLETQARHASDGLLRILAILAQSGLETAAPQCLLFDEIENGINPDLMERLIHHLLAIPHQSIVTTHSPLILNYLPDAVARESVILMDRTRDGHCRALRFFDLPEPARKLALLGPGEVFVDTDLSCVAQGEESASS